MDYRKTAQDILDHVGGSKNIASAAHCATRLRLVIADNKKVSKEALENIDGVKGVFEASGQLQIILGIKYLPSSSTLQVSQQAQKQRRKRQPQRSRTGSCVRSSFLVISLYQSFRPS